MKWGHTVFAHIPEYRCLLVLHVFCGDKLLGAHLGPSKIDPCRHACATLSLRVRRFSQVWPVERIVLRADSGFARWHLMRWFERNDVHYILGLAKNSRLEGASKPWCDQAKRRFRQRAVKHRLFGEFRHAAYTWDTERRVIVKAEHTAQGSNRASSSPTARAIRRTSTTPSTSHAARWKTASKSSRFTCSPTAPVPTGYPYSRILRTAALPLVFA